MSKLENNLRPIRSYVLRQGRMTFGQRDALGQYWPQYGLKAHEINPVNWQSVFKRDAKRMLEIGFGMGDTLIALAQKHPDIDFIGIEVHQPGVGRILAKAQSLNLTNLKIFSQDAIMVLERSIPNASLDKIFVLFPDPWPKKKHHKRRLIQPEFVDLVGQKLKIGGQFHLATDWQNYADHMLIVLDNCPVFLNYYGKGNFAPDASERPPTKFEMRGLKLGHSIWDLLYVRH